MFPLSRDSHQFDVIKRVDLKLNTVLACNLAHNFAVLG